jgi:hypothetical protein
VRVLWYVVHLLYVVELVRHSCGKAAFDTLETDCSQGPCFLVSFITHFISKFSFHALPYLQRGTGD